MRAMARDWPLPDRMWELFVWLIFVAVLSIFAREAMGAEPAKVEGARVAVTQAAPAASPQAALFDDLAATEDPALGDHVATGSLTAGELALIIVFLILLFPVGIILLIVFLLDDD
jgi:hypothetical protein